MPRNSVTGLTACAVAGVGGSLALAMVAAQAQLQRPGGLCVVKYHDSNANGQADPGEARLPGWAFALYDQAGGQIGRVRTDRAGRGCFGRGVAAGSYSVREEPLSGWRNTDPGTTPPEKPAIVQAGRTTELLFGNCSLERDRRCRVQPPRLGRLCAVKYHDANGNGQRDAGEGPLAGWRFMLLGPGGSPMGQVQTDESGRACFSRPVPAGNYLVREDPVISGWMNTDPGGASPTKPVAIPSGGTAHVSFGNCRRSGEGRCKPADPDPGRLCIRKYEDLNGDGNKQSNEPFAVGWTFEILDGANKVVSQTVSGPSEDQACERRYLAPGNYLVREESPLPAGWTNTDPGGGQLAKPAVVASNQITYVLFGNRQRPTGSLRIEKFVMVDGPLSPPSAVSWTSVGQFDVAVTCTTKTSTLQLHGGNQHQQTLGGIPQGETCAIEETASQPLQHWGTGPCRWLVDYPDGQAATIGAQTVYRRVVNEQICTRVDDPSHAALSITPTVTASIGLGGQYSGFAIPLRYKCSALGGAWQSSVVTTATSASGTLHVSVPAGPGSTCEVEIDPNAALPSLAGTHWSQCQWGPPDYSNLGYNKPKTSGNAITLAQAPRLYQLHVSLQLVC